MRRTAIAVVGLLLAGCALKYVAPRPGTEVEPSSVIVDASYDETWQRLVEHLTGSFYSIELMDRDSGFMRLDFTASDPEEFIDCGDVAGNYAGPYAHYLRDKLGYDLHVRMNVHVTPVTSTQTRVRVHARYMIGHYVFETGTSVTRNVILAGSKPKPTKCQPRHIAERTLLDATGAGR